MVNGLSRFSAAVGCLYRPADVWTFPGQLFESLGMLLDADLVSYDEFGPNNHLVTLSNPEGVNTPYLPQFAAHVLEHPVVQRIANQDIPKGPAQLSHYLPHRKWRRTALYNEAFRPLGLKYQLGAVFKFDTLVVGFAFLRVLKDFSRDENELLGEFIPHVEAALRNAKMFSTLQSSAFAQGAWIIVDARSTVVEQSPAAIELLRRYNCLEPSNRLADNVRRWLENEYIRLRERFPPSPPKPLVINNDCGELTMGVVPEDATRAKIWFSEKTSENEISRLQSLGLTARQTEVLYWASQGKRNEEIATILGAAPRTVAKHMEAIFAKLGVESRSAAALTALEALNGSRLP